MTHRYRPTEDGATGSARSDLAITGDIALFFSSFIDHVTTWRVLYIVRIRTIPCSTTFSNPEFVPPVEV